MEALKHSIIEASEAVEEEKRKNVELLRMIFPANIAQKLWRGRCSESILLRKCVVPDSLQNCYFAHPSLKWLINIPFLTIFCRNMPSIGLISR